MVAMVDCRGAYRLCAIDQFRKELLAEPVEFYSLPSELKVTSLDVV